MLPLNPAFKLRIQVMSIVLLVWPLVGVPPARAATVAVTSFYSATDEAYKMWISSRSTSLPPKTTQFPTGTDAIALYYEYTGATPRVTTFTIAIYNTGGTQVGTLGSTLLTFRNGLAMRLVRGPYPDGIYHATLKISGAPDLSTSFAVGSATSTALPTGSFDPILSADFSREDTPPWIEGAGPTGAAKVVEGRLRISVSNGNLKFGAPPQTRRLADGQIDAIVRPQGRGQVGVMARWNGNAARTLASYAFWITGDGSAGLTEWRDHSPTNLFVERRQPIMLNQDNLLVLRVQGGQITTSLNGVAVQTVTVSTPLATGGWGPYVYSVMGNWPTTGAYARILIAG